MASHDTTPSTSSISHPTAVGPPPLQAGDRLNRIEFERRYNAMPEVTNAELVEGVVYMPSPVRADRHGEPHFDLNGWLFVYRAHTPGVRGGDNSSLRLDMANMPQPDSYLRIESERGGKSRLCDDGIIDGPPELIAEIAASSVSRDLHDKLQAYQRNLVDEYLVFRTLDGEIDWFQSVDGNYQKLPADHGILRSRILPGLWLNVSAAINNDAASVLATLQQGIDSDEHRQFADRLKSIGQD